MNLSCTRIHAVQAGTVANKNVAVGNFVQPGDAPRRIAPGMSVQTRITFLRLRWWLDWL